MRNPLLYIFFFIVVILLQLLVFDKALWGVYLHPLAYVAIVLLLPMQMHPALVLTVGLLTGVTMDLFTGDAGLNTIATLPVAILRPALLPLLAGRDQMKEGGAPVAATVGSGKFARYSLVMILIHCIIYFCFESLSWAQLNITLLRIVLGTAVTFLLVWLLQMLFSAAYNPNR